MTEPTIVDPSGDFTVHAGENGHLEIFTASPKAMSLASPVWREMLNRPGLCEQNRIDLMGDDRDALLVLLLISHLQFSRIPLRVTYGLLVELAVLCDKYKMAQILFPWISPWLADWKPYALKAGYENLFFVAWVFSDLETYTAIARNWVMKSTLDSDGHLVMGTTVLKLKIMPPGALGLSAWSSWSHLYPTNAN